MQEVMSALGKWIYELSCPFGSSEENIKSDIKDLFSLKGESPCSNKAFQATQLIETFPSFSPNNPHLLPTQFNHTITPDFVRDAEAKQVEANRIRGTIVREFRYREGEKRIDVTRRLLQTVDLDAAIGAVITFLNLAEIERDKARKAKTFQAKQAFLEKEKSFVIDVDLIKSAIKGKEWLLDARIYYIECLISEYKGVLCPKEFSSSDAYEYIRMLRRCQALNPNWQEVKVKIEQITHFLKNGWQKLRKNGKLGEKEHTFNLEGLNDLITNDPLASIFGFDTEGYCFVLIQLDCYQHLTHLYPYLKDKKSFVAKHPEYAKYLTKAEIEQLRPALPAPQPINEPSKPTVALAKPPISQPLKPTTVTPQPASVPSRPPCAQPLAPSASQAEPEQYVLLASPSARSNIASPLSPSAVPCVVLNEQQAQQVVNFYRGVFAAHKKKMEE
jgi:hypothetical protein